LINVEAQGEGAPLSKMDVGDCVEGYLHVGLELNSPILIVNWLRSPCRVVGVGRVTGWGLGGRCCTDQTN